jgi:hypothetical protein
MAGRARTRYNRLHGITCAAIKKNGERCQCKLLFRGAKGKGKKCRFHGGLSTGPKTPEGKARSLAAVQAGARRRHETMTPEQKAAHVAKLQEANKLWRERQSVDERALAMAPLREGFKRWLLRQKENLSSDSV